MAMAVLAEAAEVAVEVPTAVLMTAAPVVAVAVEAVGLAPVVSVVAEVEAPMPFSFGTMEPAVFFRTAF